MAELCSMDHTKLGYGLAFSPLFWHLVLSDVAPQIDAAIKIAVLLLFSIPLASCFWSTFCLVLDLEECVWQIMHLVSRAAPCLGQKPCICFSGAELHLQLL